MADTVATKADIAVPMAGLRVTDQASARLSTSGLGSCVAVCMFDPVKRIGGVLHAMLPLSRADEGRTDDDSAMYADTGTVALRKAMVQSGARPDRLQAALIGGAGVIQPYDEEGAAFRMGARNVAVARVMLMELTIPIVAEDTGGRFSRSIAFDLGGPRIHVRAAGNESTLEWKHDVEKR